MKVGIAGVRGLSNLIGFNALEDVQVTALCDLDEDLLQQQQKEHGIANGHRVFDDMLESDIDAVVIATPMQCHVPQAITALQAGKHVMSEVTAGVAMDELWWLIENVEQSGKVYMMAENYCYMPDNQLILNLVKKGMLGDVYYSEGEYLHNSQSLVTYNYGMQQSGKTSWRKYWQLGKRGAFYPTHSIGPVMQWFGEDRITSITSFGSGRHCDLRLRQEDTNITMCQLASHKLARIRLDTISPRPHQMTYYTIQGTKGVVEASRIHGQEAMVWLKGMDDSIDEAEWRPLNTFKEHLPERYLNATDEQKNAGHAGGDFFIVEDFVNAIQKGTPPAIDVYQACEWTAVGLLSELSITNQNRTMDMPNFRKNMPYEEQIIKL
ncbi:MAG: Gfo/Idh/MocA family oxidoreductase [bacterium]|nr:Gfo/Idh/MocA family oxidoreductase [bacterium]